MVNYPGYRAALDHILLNGKPEDLMRFMRKYGLKVPDREVLEVTFHKTITAAKTLPKAHRQASKRWLDAHGYHSLDDGDL